MKKYCRWRWKRRKEDSPKRKWRRGEEMDAASGEEYGRLLPIMMLHGSQQRQHDVVHSQLRRHLIPTR
jgi:hypothetical protein